MGCQVTFILGISTNTMFDDGEWMLPTALLINREKFTWRKVFPLSHSFPTVHLCVCSFSQSEDREKHRLPVKRKILHLSVYNTFCCFQIPIWGLKNALTPKYWRKGFAVTWNLQKNMVICWTGWRRESTKPSILSKELFENRQGCLRDKHINIIITSWFSLF